jgi:hypothetical protein
VSNGPDTDLRVPGQEPAQRIRIRGEQDARGLADGLGGDQGTDGGVGSS